MNDNFVMLGTSVPYCDYAAEIGVSPVLNEHELVVAMTVIPNISAVTVDHQTKTCFIRPQAGQPAEMTDRYIYRQAIDITAPIQKNDLARGNLIYAVFNALMPLDIDERTVVRLHFADEAGNTFGGWNQYYLSGVRAIETYTPATIWQQVR